jgi:hypothetical protein
LVNDFGYTPIRKYVDWEWQEVRYLEEYLDDAIDDEIPYTYELEK